MQTELSSYLKHRKSRGVFMHTELAILLFKAQEMNRRVYAH